MKQSTKYSQSGDAVASIHTRYRQAPTASLYAYFFRVRRSYFPYNASSIKFEPMPAYWRPYAAKWSKE